MTRSEARDKNCYLFEYQFNYFFENISNLNKCVVYVICIGMPTAEYILYMVCCRVGVGT